MIGAACKWIDKQGTPVQNKNLRTTTVTYCSKLDPVARHEQLWSVLEHNLEALSLVVQALSIQPEATRMWRIGSELLPLYTHTVAKEFYSDTDVIVHITKMLCTIGKLARKAGVRLSFHPSQFVVIGSQSQEVRERSIIELEYHALCAELMGYKTWHKDGFCINVHVGGKQADPKVVRAEIKAMSKVLRNNLTLENDEFSWGVQEILDNFGDLVPCVVDVHHHWIQTGKQPYIGDLDFWGVVDTWRSGSSVAKPKIHLAMSQKDLIPPQFYNTAIPLQAMIDPEMYGAKKGNLRVHSASPWHLPTLDYAQQFHDAGYDVMWEGKDKNLGQAAIAKHFKLI